MIYIHIPKTAGSFISQFLIKEYNFKTYYRNNYLYGNPDHSQYASPEGDPRRHSIECVDTTRIGGIVKYYTNADFYEYSGLNNGWDSYYKFTFVRNPYDKLISAYQYLSRQLLSGRLADINKHNGEHYETFDGFIDAKNDIMDVGFFVGFFTQYQQLLNRDGIMAIDYIGHIEDGVETQLNLLFKRTHDFTPYYKNKNESLGYKPQYNDTLIGFVNEWFNDDFEHFGYTKRVPAFGRSVPFAKGEYYTDRKEK